MNRRLREGVKSISQQISIDRTELNAFFREVKKFRDYASGKQETTLTLEQQKMLEGILGNDYCDNICGQVLSEHADRLELKRITCEDDTVQKWIDNFWQRVKFDDLQQRTHRSSLRDGNFCLMVEYDYDNEYICIHREKWWDGNTGVFIGYDSYGKMLYAVKEWETLVGRRRTVYYEGAIERYSSLGSSNTWQPYVLSSDLSLINNSSLVAGIQPRDTDAVSVPYTDSNGNPLHIPFIHFANPGDEFDHYGTSILDGGILGAQDQVNDAQYDISAAGRMTGYQRTWSKGYRLQKINNKSVAPRTGPGVHYHAVEAEAEWGVLPAGDISQLIQVYDTKVKSFCRMTGTPYASISGNWPSGEAVYKLEQPIRGKTKARQKRFTPQWVEVMHRCIELANAVGGESLDEDAMLTAVYTDAGDRDPLTEASANLAFWQSAQAAVMAGMPLETYLRVNGWGEEELKGMSTDIKNQIDSLRSDLSNTPSVPNPRGNNGNSPGGPRPGASNTYRTPAKSTSQTARKQG